MADQLDFEIAKKLTRSLSTIDGFPRFEEAIVATAEDLVRWCSGSFAEGKRWTADQQAYWLVTEARTTWKKWQGSADLYTLFKEKFGKTVKAGNEAIDYANQPCIVCGSGRKFRECCQGKPMPPDDDTVAAFQRLVKKKSFPSPNRAPITQEDFDRLERERGKPQ